MTVGSGVIKAFACTEYCLVFPQANSHFPLDERELNSSQRTLFHFWKTSASFWWSLANINGGHQLETLVLSSNDLFYQTVSIQTHIISLLLNAC